MKKLKLIILITSLLLTIVGLTISASAISYQYDDLGRLTEVSYESGRRILYKYDAAGNIISVNSDTQTEIKLTEIGNKIVHIGDELKFSVSGVNNSSAAINYSASNLPKGAEFNTTTKEFKWTPDESQKGVYSICFIVSDGVNSDSEDVSITVLNIPTSKLTVNIIGNGTVYSNNDTWNKNSKEMLLLGTTVTLIAEDNYIDTFIYWKDSNGNVLSTNKEYTFRTEKNTNLTAVFGSNSSEKHLVTFKNGNGEIISSNYENIGSKISFPTNPSMYGYEFLGWDKTEEDVKLATGDIVVTAIFEKIDKKCIVIVNGGKGSGEFSIKDYVTVVADPPEENKKFLHWIDANNNVLCHELVYKFFVTSDKILTAVYVDDTNEIEQSAEISITSTKIDAYNKKLTFVVERSVPKGCSVISHGIVLTKNSMLNKDEFIIGANGVLKGTSKTTGLIGVLIVNKKNVESGDTWFARGYVIYEDSKGDIKTVYSRIVSETMTK